MAFRDEKTFSDDEFAQAFEFVMPADQARKLAAEVNAIPDYKDFEQATPEQYAAAEVKGTRNFDGDMYDLLSLVSESCAERAWGIQGLSRIEGEEQRRAFLERVGQALRKQPPFLTQ